MKEVEGKVIKLYIKNEKFYTRSEISFGGTKWKSRLDLHLKIFG